MGHICPGCPERVKLPKEAVPNAKREPKEPKVKKEPKIKRDPDQPDIRDSMGSNAGSTNGDDPPTLQQRLAARAKKGAKPSPKKKKPWETDSEASNDFISDPSDPSDSDGGFSDDDSKPSNGSFTKPTNGAKAKLEPVKEEAQSDNSDIQAIEPVKKAAPVKRKLGPITNAPKPTATAKKQSTLNFSAKKEKDDAFDLSDDDVPIVKRTAVKSKPAAAKKPPAKKPPAKATLKKRKSWQSDDSSEDEQPKKGRKKVVDSDSGSDFNDTAGSPVIPNYSSRGAAKKPVKYNFSDSESD